VVRREHLYSIVYEDDVLIVKVREAATVTTTGCVRKIPIQSIITIDVPMEAAEDVNAISNDLCDREIGTDMSASSMLVH
jgi:hypothetical protein